MHDLAVLGHQRALHDLVVGVDLQRLGLLVDHGREEVQQVAREQRGGIVGELGRQVGRADDLDAVLLDDLAELGRAGSCRPARPPCRRSPSPASWSCTMSSLTSTGALRPGISAVVTTMSCVLMCSATSAACLALVVRAHLLGVAARGLGRLELLVLDGDELGAERLHLLLGRRPHVGRRDDRAEPARRGDRLQARHADAHDEGARRRERAGRASSSAGRCGRNCWRASSTAL